MNLRDLRSLEDWLVRYQLNSVPGVAEVESVGGYVQQSQVDVDPNKLRGYSLPLSTVVEAVQRSNNNVGGNVSDGLNQTDAPNYGPLARLLDDIAADIVI